MKILFVVEYFPHEEITGGVEARAYHLSKRLAEDHDVSVICSRQPGQPEESVRDGVRVHRVGSEHPYSSEGDFLTRVKFADAAIEKGKELDFDLVDGQSFLAYLPAHAIGEEAGVPKVATYHETWIGEWIQNKGVLTGIGGELWERMSLDRDWDGIISVSEFTKDRLVEHGVDGDLIEVVPNGVDLSEFDKVEGEEYGRPTVCTVSRLTEKKRVDLVMRAFEEVSREVPQSQLKIVGKGPERDRLESLSEELEADIELLGYLPNKADVIGVMKASDLFVSASVLEGFGMSVIEAAASGTPYVVSNIPPHVEVTKGERGGLVFDRDKAEDLVEKMERMLTDEELYDRKREECPGLAEEYEWEKIVKKLEKTYRSVIEET